MALRIVLKPGEQLYVGNSRIIVESEQYVTFIIEGDGPVLRERDYLLPTSAPSRARQICLTLQSIYLKGSSSILVDQYISQVKELLVEWPDAAGVIAEINTELDGEHAYAALKAARGLLLLENQSVDHDKTSQYIDSGKSGLDAS